MIKKSVFEDELIAGMQRELTASDQSVAVDHLGSAVDSLHAAVEIFEEAGMKAQADAVLNILLKIAKNHKPHGKGKKDPHTDGLTSEKMIANLMQHGTEFNMDDDESINDLLEADIEQPESFDEDYRKYLHLRDKYRKHHPAKLRSYDVDPDMRGLVETDDSDADFEFETDELEVSDKEDFSEMNFEDEL